MEYESHSIDRMQQLLLPEILVRGLKSESRNGPVLRFRNPVILRWTNPRNRVVVSPVRDANPFFHLMESLWMLGGRNDVELPAYYASNMKNYSDDGKVLNGAYGYRWRNHFNHDQLSQWVIPELARDPASRRVVLQMWDGLHDPKSVQNGTYDVPCNLACTFYLTELRHSYELDMTVFNRSNDSIFGALGANVVHFSMLQEYVACALGQINGKTVDVGVYNQVSSNLHLYLEFDITKRFIRSDYAHGTDRVSDAFTPEYADEWARGLPKFNYDPTPYLFDGADQRGAFDADTILLLEAYKSFDRLKAEDFGTEFYQKVVWPMGSAYWLYKNKGPEEAAHFLDTNIGPATDWTVNGYQWLLRRVAARKAKEGQKQ
jgi:hypothetical protein